MTNQKYDILSPAGSLIRQHILSANCSRKFSLMNEDSITLRFTTREAMQFPVGTSVGDFFITQEQVGKWNASTGVWDYELKFDAYYWLWANKILRYIIPDVDSARETSFTLTATIEIHANVILNCLSFLGIEYGCSPFRVDTTDTSLSREAKLVRYENLSILGGIQAIAEAFDCEWWIIGNAIYFGRCENGDSKHVFEAGINTSSISFQQAKSEAPNRLYVYGSDRNLPANYRKVDGNDTIGGVVARRLMLPEGIPYLQTDPDIPENQIVEKVVVLDSVYPRTDLTVSEEPETYTSSSEDEDGNKTSETYYRLRYGDSFRFSESYVLPNEELHIIFQSGMLNGMEFGAKFNPKGLNEKNTDGSWNPDAQMIEVVVNEDYGRRLPDDVLKPQKGDMFILSGWDSTKMADLGLIADAEQELLEEGKKALDEYAKDLSTCTCPMAWDYMKPLFATNSQPKPGDVVTIIDTAHFSDGGRRSRIIGYEYKIDKPYAECVYTCGENVSVKRLDSIEKKIEGLAKSGTKVQMQNSLDFLSKRYSDRTPYLLSSDKGFEVGNFVSGASGAILGKDAETGQTFGEMDRLFIRVKAYFETLTIINAETLAGKQYITPGGSVKITSVEEVKDSKGTLTGWRCYFLSEQDGEKTETKMIVGDQAISEMFNAKTGTSNKVSNHRYWRLVTAVSNDAYEENGNHYGYIELSATNCEVESDAPEAGDMLCQLGHQGTDNAERQTAMVFSTVDTDAPSIKMYSGINSYSLNDKAIISFGRDPLTNQVYFRLGNSTAKEYLEYTQNNGLKVAGSITTTSTIGDKTLNQYFTDLIPEVSQEDIEGYVNAITKDKFDNLQSQIDGSIMTYFQHGVPTLSNYPANEWGDNQEKDKHLGDLYYDKDTGFGYRFEVKDGGGYEWALLKDTDIAKALAAAAEAQDTADGKRKTFVVRPKSVAAEPDNMSYDVGDIWVNATYPADTTKETRDPSQGKYFNDILRCITPKTKVQAFDIADWGLASNYTDDTLAQSAKDEIAGYQYIKEALTNGATITEGSLILSGLIKLGLFDLTDREHPLQIKVYAGLNGIFKTDKSPILWGGGDMIDRFYKDDGTQRQTPLTSGFATSMIRMDGSAYFGGGAHAFNPDGTGWLGDKDNGIKFAGDGSLILGSGIKINLNTGEKGLKETIESFANILTYFVPEDSTGKTVAWGGNVARIRVTKGFYSDSFISARGANPDGGTSGGATQLRMLDDVLLGNNLASGQALVYNGSKWVNQAISTGLDESALANYLTTNNYAKKTDIPSLTVYAKEEWVEGKGYLTDYTIHALTLQSGWFSAETYNPKSAAKTVNIPTTTSHITEGTRLYFTDARAQSALASTVTGINTAISGKVAKAGDTMSGLLTLNAGAKIISGQKLVIGDCEISWDSANGGLKFSKGIYSESYVSARGANSSGGSSSGGGASYNRLDNWADYAASKAGYVLSAKLGYDLYSNKADKSALSDYATKTWVRNENYVNVGSDGVSEIGRYLDFHTYSNGIRGSEDYTARLDAGSAATSRVLTLPTTSGTLATQEWVSGKNYLTSHQSLANYAKLRAGNDFICHTNEFNFVPANYNNKIWFNYRCEEGTGTISGYHFGNGASNAGYAPIVASSIIKNGGTASQILMADGSVRELLDLTTITHFSWVSATTTGVKIPSMKTLAYWNGRYDANSSNLQYCDRGRFGTMAVANASDYLPLTGGTLKNGSSITPLIISTNSTSEIGVRFSLADVAKGWLGYTSTYGTNLYNYAANTYLGLRDNGQAYVGNNLIWHQGNDGSGSGLDADLWDGEHRSSYKLNKYYLLDLTNLSSSNFYPVVFEYSSTEIDCEISSPNYSAGAAYNNNSLHFLLSSMGWSDLKPNFKVLKASNYQNEEITIGAVGRGMKHGENAVWLRGGLKYIMYSNTTPYLKTSNYSNENETFTVGTGLSGGTNTAVEILWQNDAANRYNALLATLQSNVASASKLANTRTIWGQNFNGEQDIWGSQRLTSSLTGAGGDIYMELWRGTNASWKILNSNGNLYFQNNYTTKVTDYFNCVTFVYNSGNVGIGTTNPTFKADIYGETCVRNAQLRIGDCARQLILRNDGNNAYFMFSDAVNGGFNALRPLYFNCSNGNVYIGNGALAAEHGGSVMVGVNLNVGNAINAGNAGSNGWLEIYHATPYIDFHFGRSTADYTSRIIEEASGRLAILGTLRVSVGMYSDGYVSARGQNTSDKRLKTNIRDFNASAIIKGLRPVAFKWNALAKSKFEIFRTDEVQYGLIAQETEKVARWLVKDGMFGDEYKGVWYEKLIPVLAKCQKEQMFRIDNLLVSVKSHEKRIAELERENRELKRRIKILERR